MEPEGLMEPPPAGGQLDQLPDDLLLRCLAGAGGRAIAAAACAGCHRLRGLAGTLRHLPVFSSAASSQSSLQSAIRDAAHRALAGVCGPVDFALIFVGNFSAGTKKYADPLDVHHAADMLRDVLLQDVPWVLGCAASGIMGVGPDSAPLEVDPACSEAWGRRIAAARRRAGLPALPSKGVSVLLGTLPPGCVVRGLAMEEYHGPVETADPATAWRWPAFEEALQLTAEEQARLAAELHRPAAAAGSAEPAGQQVQLVPQQCLLLSRAAAFGSLDPALEFMAARGIQVVGGASSGSGDLLWHSDSGGVEAPAVAMLLFCTAQAASPATATAAAAAAAAAGSGAAAGQEPAGVGQGVLGSAPGAAAATGAAARRQLTAAAMSVAGLGPVPGCSVYSNVLGTLNVTTGVALASGLHLKSLACQLHLRSCTRAAAAGAAADASSAPAAATTPAAGAGSSAAGDAAGQPARRSQRGAAAAAAAQASGLVAFRDEVDSGFRQGAFEPDSSYVALYRQPPGSRPQPFSGAEPDLFVPEAPLVTIDCVDAPGGGDGTLTIPLAFFSPAERERLQQLLSGQGPGTLCMQAVAANAAGRARTLQDGLGKLLAAVMPQGAQQQGQQPQQQEQHGTEDLYEALAGAARSEGARSSRVAVVAFSCTGRGQAAFLEDEDDAQGFGAVTESRLLDEAASGRTAFAGVFCDGEIGPPVQRLCSGFFEPAAEGGRVSGSDEAEPRAAMQAYTAMFAALACQPGSV